jgi:hypothetical protein
MRKLLLTLAAVLLMAAPAGAASGVAGKWTGETQGRNGPQKITLELKTAGEALTGTMATGDTPPVAVEDGKVSGAKVSFTTTRSIQGFDLKVKWSGEAKDDTLTLAREFTNLPEGAGAGGAGPPPPVVLSRTK